MRFGHPFAALLIVTIAALPTAVAAKPKKAPPPPAAAAPTPAPATSTIGVDTQARHAIIIDADTGAVLLEKAADEPFPPASMSKMMTAYVVFTYLRDGRAKLTDTLPISTNAWHTGGSKMFVPVGQRVPIEDLIKGMIIDSGNDACVALAEGLAGSVDAFVEQMNEMAKKLGLKNSHFANVDGLPDPNGVMSARDLAMVAWHTIHDFPQYYKYYSETSFTFSNITQQNRNPLLYKGVGADGLKTGFTDASGYGLTASAVRNGRRIIGVFAGLPTGKARNEESERLVEWAFREYDDYKLVAAGATVDTAPVWLGAHSTVPLTVAKDFIVTLPRKARPHMKVTIDYDGPIPAPVKKGEALGKIVVEAPGAQQGSAPLVAATDISRMGPAGRIATLAGYLIWGER